MSSSLVVLLSKHLRLLNHPTTLLKHTTTTTTINNRRFVSQHCNQSSSIGNRTTTTRSTSSTTRSSLPILSHHHHPHRQQQHHQYQKYSYYSSDTNDDTKMEPSSPTVVVASSSSTANTNNNKTPTATTTTTEDQSHDQQRPSLSNTNNTNNNNHNNKKRGNKRSKWSWTKKLKDKKRKQRDLDEGGDATAAVTSNQQDDTTTTNTNDEDGGNSNDDDTKKNGKFNRRHRARTNSHDATLEPVHRGSYACPAMQTLFPNTIVPSPPTPSSSESSTITRDPKRKVALLIGFLGTSYVGMQINESQRTIQAELELALVSGKLLTHANFGYPPKYGWSNAARTDKGVHSCAQVCSVKIVLPAEVMGGGEEGEGGIGGGWEEGVRTVVNKHLPADIRVLDVIKVTKSFCAKTARDRVRYQYMFPSFMVREWCRDDNTTNVGNLIRSTQSSSTSTNGGTMDLSPEKITTLQASLTSTRITPTEQSTLTAALTLYNGTHSFQNYTSGKKASDPSAIRYIHSVTLQDPIIDERTGMEWIPVEVVGQSFLLHQIRKMMCMAMDVVRGRVGLDVMAGSLIKAKKGGVGGKNGGEGGDEDEDDDGSVVVRVNVAPAQGLFLDMSYYETYNRRNPTHDRIDWQQEQVGGGGNGGMERWKEFKEGTVIGHIMEEEEREGNFVKYLVQREYYAQTDDD